MTSAPTGIGDGKHYVLMSSDLEGLIELEGRGTAKAESWCATVVTFDRNMILPISGIECDQQDTYVVCLQVEGSMEVFTRLLIESVDFSTVILGSSFNSKVVKLESGRAYLRLLR